MATCLVIAAVTALRGQQALTPEWIAGEIGARFATVPETAWRRDGSLWIFDDRDPGRPAGFELLDPATGSRRMVRDARSILAAINAVLAPPEPLKTLPWPTTLDAAGEQGLYVLDGDIVLVRIETGDVTSVTKTPAAETAANFSPDGRKISFVRDRDLFVFDIRSRAETRLTRDGSETVLNGTLSWVYWEEIFGRRDTGYWWADDSRTIAFLQADESAVTTAHFVDFAPIPPRLITQRYPVAGTANPKVRLGIVDIDSPRPVWVALDPQSFEYILRVKWLPGSKQLAVQTMPRDQRRLDLFIADRSGDGLTHLLTEADPAWINVTDDLYFLRNGHFIWASERDGFMHLYRYRMDGSLVNQITKGDWAIASNAGGVSWLRQSVAAIDERNDWIYFLALEKSSVERQLYRVHSDGAGFSRVSSESGTHAVRFSPDAQYYTDRFATSRTLPSLSLRSADGRHLHIVSTPRTEILAPFGVRYGELLTIPASDGFRMPAQMLKPAGFNPGRRYPVIMFVYGGPSAPMVADDLPRYFLFNQLLLQEGFIVVLVDNRSATGISKKLANTIFGRHGEFETADLVDAARWLKKQPYVDASRVGVWGWSGGGTMTLELMTRSAEFKAGIAVAPATDWRYYDTKWTESFMGLPANNRPGYEATSLIPRAKDLHGRLLLVHGTYDDNVHPQHSQAFMDALIAHGIVFDSMIYPMRQHGIADRQTRAHLFKTMIDFWKRAL